MQFTNRVVEETAPAKSILLVDDEAPSRVLMTIILNQAGYTVQSASDGCEAARRLQGEDDISLLVTDLAMPGMNGVELARFAKSLRPNLPVLFVSGHLDCFPVSPNVPSIAKPFTPFELIAAVESALVATRRREALNANIGKLGI